MEPRKPVIGAWVVSSTPKPLENKKVDSSVDLISHSLSLPGFKIFLTPKTNIWRKIIWFCVFSIAIALCAYQISERVRYYLEYPVFTAFAVTSSTTIRFPNITICSFNPHSSTTFYKYFNETKYSMYDVYNILKEPGKTVNDLWEMSAENREDFILNCTYGKRSCLSPEYWTFEDNACGRCHVLTFNEDVPYIGADSQIKLTLKDVYVPGRVNDSVDHISLKIFLHNVYVNKIFGSFIQSSSVYTGVWARFRYWIKEFVYENTPVHPCVEPFNYSACMQMCYEEQLYDASPKCRLPFSVYTRDYPLCTYDQFLSIYNYTLINTFAKIDASKCDCGRPCKDMNYDIKPDYRSTKEPGKSTVIIAPGRADTESMYEVRAYTHTSLVSDIGGALGLYLGACILTFFEIINLAYQAVIRKKQQGTEVTKTWFN
ncbi:acid-sensing (proton-gated) ion channel [Chamberlinius hualienensis]